MESLAALASKAVCQQLEFSTGGHSSMHGGDESTWRRQNKAANLRCQRARVEYGGPERDSQTHLNLVFKNCCPDRGRFTSFGESDQTSIRWRIRNVVHTFVIASVLSRLDFVRDEVEVQEVLQGLRVAKNNNSTCVYLGLVRSARARRLDVHTTAEGTEARQI
jgi:hypothetical protein